MVLTAVICTIMASAALTVWVIMKSVSEAK